MKKIMIVIAALAMAISFMPEAESGETAELGLSVTFDQPLMIESYPTGPFKLVEGTLLEFKVQASDPDANLVTLEAVLLPEGATFEIIEPLPEETVVPNYAVGLFKWTPYFGQAKEDPYLAVFEAKNDKGEIARLEVAITVLPAVISIELVDRDGNPVSGWSLEGIRLGEKRDNIAYFGADMPIHHVKNTGNVDVGVDIGYGYLIAEGIQPGRNQGLDTFITGLGRVDNHVLLEPNGKLMVGGAKPGDAIPLWLTYGAPTALSNKNEGHGVTYELRAYPVTE